MRTTELRTDGAHFEQVFTELLTRTHAHTITRATFRAADNRICKGL